MTKTFTIALFACALSGTAISAQQKEQPKDKSGAFSQPAEPQPVIMPAGQRPDEWKFGKEKEAEAIFRSSSLAPQTVVTLQTLAALEPTTLAVMHGASFSGDGGAALRELANEYDKRYFSAQTGLSV